MVNWITFLVIAIILVAADKGLTYFSLKAVERNYPNLDPISVEKNPAARYFFYNYGLSWGSVLFGVVSVFTFFVAMSLLWSSLRWFFPANPWGISLYVMCMAYGLVIMNNVYMLIKHSKLL